MYPISMSPNHSEYEYTSVRTNPTPIVSRDNETRAASDDQFRRLSNVVDTPAKAAGRPNLHSGVAVRPQVTRHLAHELLNNQVESSDLVSHAFSDLIPHTLAAKVMLFLLHSGVLHVFKPSLAGDSNPLERQEWPIACAHSAKLLAVSLDPFISELEEGESRKARREFANKYHWSWHTNLRTNSEEHTVEFFNVVGALAYMAARRFGSEFAPCYRTRLITMPRRYHPLPLAHNHQDCRPDLVALPCSAFSNTPDPNRVREFHEISSPVLDIGRYLSHRPDPVLDIEHYPPTPDLGTEHPARTPSLRVNVPIAPADYDAASSTKGAFLVDADPYPCLGSSGPASSDVPVVKSEKTASQSPPNADCPVPATPPQRPVTASADNDSPFDSVEQELQALQHAMPAYSDLIQALEPEERARLEAKYVDMSRVCWPGVSFVGENKQTKIPEGVKQELVYMQQHRLTQPHMRSVLGIALTKEKIVFIRADPAGIEQQAIQTMTCSGVLETVRLVLGLAVADDTHLGVHPGFDFADVEEPAATTAATKDNSDNDNSDNDNSDNDDDYNDDAYNDDAYNDDAYNDDDSLAIEPPEFTKQPSGSKRKSKFPTATSNKRKRAKAASDPDPPRHYRYRQAAFFTLNGMQLKVFDRPDATVNWRCYLHHLADNSGPLVGRTGRVWVAYMEVDASSNKICDEQRATVEGQGKVFVGPYALKLQHIDMRSQTYTASLMTKIQKEASESTDSKAKCLLVPDHILHGRSIRDVVRRYHTGIGDSVRDRMEVITISPFKRTLGQYNCFEEVARATLDIYRAIAWLDENKYVHRDISHGNVLLAREEPTQFNDATTNELELMESDRCRPGRMTVHLRRRQHDPASSGYGLLHDFDMVGVADLLGKEVSSPGKGQRGGFRTGTSPFMSIGVLLGISNPHTVRDDLQSLFYVLYLFPFSFGPPSSETTYPYSSPSSRLRWPRSIIQWSEGPDLKQLGLIKSTFFAFKSFWVTEPFEEASKEIKEHWMTGEPREAWEKLVVMLHDQFLWHHDKLGGLWIVVLEPQVADIIAAMEKHINELDAAGGGHNKVTARA